MRSLVIQKILPKVIQFEEAVNTAIQQTNATNKYLAEIKDCPIDEIELRLKKIQGIINEFDVANASNLEIWIQL